MKKWQIFIPVILFGAIALFLLGYFFVFQKKPPESFQKPKVEQVEIQKEGQNLLLVENLRQKKFDSEIKIERTLAENPTFTKQLISYFSNGLKITGVMNVPKGDGSFPAIILNHPYLSFTTYKSGDGTGREADFLASKGFVTIAPDYRGYGGSDNAPDGPGLLRNGYVLDVLNLIPAVKKLSFVDPKRIGIWGHSMGAGIAIRAVVVSPDILATVLFAPRSANLSDEFKALSQSHDQLDKKIAASFKESFSSPSKNPTFFEKISPVNFLNQLLGPVMIHHSQNDNHNPFSWSEKLANALKNSGKEVEFISYAGSQHTFQGTTWQKAMEKTLEFFNRNLK